jgi:hypothetical protein
MNFSGQTTPPPIDGMGVVQTFLLDGNMVLAADDRALNESGFF